jgi:hypothetical protein
MIMNIMQCFGAATGLKINISKSIVAPIWFSQIILNDVLHNFEGETIQFPVTYLGMLLNLGCLKMTHLQPVLDRASSKLSGWQGKLFNIGGHKELVKLVLSSIPTYLLTSIKAPKGFHKAMNKIQRRFLWAGTQQIHGGKCKVSWGKVCHPHHCGGLGIADLDAFGRALRLRWLWFQWVKPDKPWCNTELPIDSIDEDLFIAAMRVMVHDGCTT